MFDTSREVPKKKKKTTKLYYCKKEGCYRSFPNGFNKKFNYKRHIREHDPNFGPFKCDPCKLSFKRKAQLFDHKKSQKHNSFNCKQPDWGLNNQKMDQNNSHLNRSDPNDSQSSTDSLGEVLGFKSQNSGLNVGSDSGLSMRTHQQSSNESSEDSEGQLKILELRNKKLKELLKARTQQIQTSNEIQAIKDDCKKHIIEKGIKLQFATNQNNLQSSLLEQLQKTLEVYAPNAPIIQSVSEFLKNRNNCPNFSQIKCQEFYASLSTGSDPSPSHSSLNSIAEVLVPESQDSGLNDDRMVRLSGTFPSQIPITQIYSSDISMPSAHQSMDTTSVQSIDETDNSQNSSHSQNTTMIWNSIRPVLEHKFNSDMNLLNSKFFGQRIGLFDDKWLNTEELDDFTESLNNLATDMNLKIQPFIKN